MLATSSPGKVGTMDVFPLSTTGILKAISWKIEIKKKNNFKNHEVRWVQSE